MRLLSRGKGRSEDRAMSERQMVMGTIYWTGGADDNDFSSSGNWSGGASPTTGDVCILASDPASGADNISAGDHTGRGNLTLIVGPNWTGNIGTSSADLELKLTKFEYAGQGDTVRIKADSSVTITECYISDTGSGAMPLRLQSTGTITNLRVTGGKGTITLSGGDSFMTVTTCEVIGATRATLDMASAGTVKGTTMRVNDGVAQFLGPFTTCEVSGRGSVEISGTPTIGTLELYGGTCRWNTSGASSAISSKLAVYSGKFDASACTASVSTIAGTEIFSDGIIDERNGLESITWSGGIVSHGGTLNLDPGRVVTVT